jgi:hypothetical protein
MTIENIADLDAFAAPKKRGLIRRKHKFAPNHHLCPRKSSKLTVKFLTEWLRYWNNKKG